MATQKLNSNETEASFEKIIQFMNAANQYLSRNQKERSKLTFFLDRAVSKLKHNIDAYNEEIRDKRVALASTDEKGNLIEVEFNKGTEFSITKYAYTPENQKK